MGNKLKKAAAVSYELGETAPKIIALGKGEVAKRIIKTAEENNVPVFENSGLVDTLLQLEIGDQIPPELYGVVAEILVFISNIDRIKGGKMGNNKIFGAFGEELATKYLIESGYRVLDRNFSCKTGEIDIIAVQGDTVVFVEVKTRSSNKFGLPSEAISTTKQRRIVKTSLYYLQKNKLLDYMCRFDVIEIIVDEDNSHRINLIKDAFQYSGRYGY